MCAKVRLSVVQRKILRIFVNTGPEVTFCQKILRIKAILRKILRISVILRIRIFVNRKILILRMFLRKTTILTKILRIRLILRIRIFVNTGPGSNILMVECLPEAEARASASTTFMMSFRR